jgi:AGZA family xanthine/uracil permease-like MFS transporter
VNKLLQSYFQITEKGSSISTELLAGVSTFLALSYIFVVNPAILAQAGMDPNAVLFATIVASSLATIAMGLWARLPFASAPGMEMNAYVAYFVVGSLGLSWQQAMGAVFWSGVIFLILTMTGLRQKTIDAIPERMKAGLSFSVGVFLALIALKIGGVLAYDGVHLRGVGSIFSHQASALVLGFALVLLLEWFRIRGSVLISIVLTSVFCFALGIGEGSKADAGATSVSLNAIGQFDLGVIFNPKAFNVILILFLVDFYGSVAKFIGLTSKTSIVENGQLPRMREALLIDGAATVIGSGLGTSSITTYVESGVGIGAGGRTGLTALVCGLLMLSCFAIAPLLAYVPVVATTGALLFVATKLCPPISELKTYSRLDLLVLVLMQIVVVVTFAVDRAMLVGFVIYIIAGLWISKRTNPYLVGSTILLSIGLAIQIYSS